MRDRCPRPAGRGGRPGSTAYRPLRGQPHRHDTFLAALAHHPDSPPLAVQVIQVKPAQLADPDTGRVEQLHDGQIPHNNGPSPRIGPIRCRRGRHRGCPGGCPPFSGGQRGAVLRGGQDRGHLVSPRDLRQPAADPRGAEQRARVAGQPATAVRVGGEGAGRGRPPRQRGAGQPGVVLSRQPAPQDADVEAARAGHPGLGGVFQQRADVARVGPDRGARTSPARRRDAAGKHPGPARAVPAGAPPRSPPRAGGACRRSPCRGTRHGPGGGSAASRRAVPSRSSGTRSSRAVPAGRPGLRCPGCVSHAPQCAAPGGPHSTVTLLARLRGLSTSLPSATAQ